MDKIYKSDNQKETKKGLLGIIMCLILFCTIVCSMSVFAGYPSIQMKHCLNKDDSDQAAKIYNEKFAGTSEEEQYEEIFLDYIVETKSRWKKDELDYKEASSLLKALTAVDNKEVSEEAERMSEFIMLEGQAEECYAIAEDYYENEEYINAMKYLIKIDEAYLQYAKVTKLNELCTEAILESTKSPDSIKEYETYINKLEAYYEMVPETAFLVRKAQLEQEALVLKDVIELTKKAVDLYDQGMFKDAFATLDVGLEKYPEHGKMKDVYETYHERYVSEITEKVESLCEKENYREALEIAEKSVEVHDCEELQQLVEYVKEEKSILYRWKNNIVDFFRKIK